MMLAMLLRVLVVCYHEFADDVSITPWCAADASCDDTPEDAAGYTAEIDSSTDGTADGTADDAAGTDDAMTLPTTWCSSRLPLSSHMRTACMVTLTAAPTDNIFLDSTYSRTMYRIMHDAAVRRSANPPADSSFR